MAVHHPAPRIAAAPAGHFTRHLLEMVAAMFLGMAVFGAVLGGVLLAAGTTFQDVLETVPALAALMLAFNMTVPMALWMRHRGHATARIAEMAGGMLAVCVVAIVLLQASLIESTAICGVECALMVPMMLGVRLIRRDEDSRPARRTTS